MAWARRGSLVVVGLLACVLLPGRVEAAKPRGGKADQIRELIDKATGAFALHKYADAADSYEKAFALKPDAAVLYNAAQAHRLGGNKERALELYQSYLRMYGTEKRAEIEKHVEDLKQAIEKDRAVKNSPPVTPIPIGEKGDAPLPRPDESQPDPAETPPKVAKENIAPDAGPPPPLLKEEKIKPVVMLEQSNPPPPPPPDGSLVKKPWFWIVVAGGVAAAAVGIFLLARKEPSDPVGSLDPVSGN